MNEHQFLMLSDELKFRVFDNKRWRLCEMKTKLRNVSVVRQTLDST